jgi:hypothetical protein
MTDDNLDLCEVCGRPKPCRWWLADADNVTRLEANEAKADRMAERNEREDGRGRY